MSLCVSDKVSCLIVLCLCLMSVPSLMDTSHLSCHMLDVCLIKQCLVSHICLTVRSNISYLVTFYVCLMSQSHLPACLLTLTCLCLVSVYLANGPSVSYLMSLSQGCFLFLHVSDKISCLDALYLHLMSVSSLICTSHVSVSYLMTHVLCLSHKWSHVSHLSHSQIYYLMSGHILYLSHVSVSYPALL